jgi:hypothetical protein
MKKRTLGQVGKNKAKQTQTKPNFETTKTNANLFTAKDYEKYRDFGLRQNKAKQTQFIAA